MLLNLFCAFNPLYNPYFNGLAEPCFSAPAGRGFSGLRGFALVPYWPEFSYKLRITLAGFPTATAPAGMSLTTTDPAPTTASSPMVTPGQTITPPPSQTLLPIVMGLPPYKPLLRVGGSNGWMGVSSCTLGPIWQQSPMTMSATSSAISPKLMNTLLPTLMWQP